MHPKTITPPLKKKGICYVCGKPGHYAARCRFKKRNDNPPKPRDNLVDGDDIIAAVVSQVNMVTITNK